MVTTKLLTAADLERMGPDGERFELIEGELREAESVGMIHGNLGMDLATHANVRVLEHRLGAMFDSDTQYVVTPDGHNVLRPDAEFVRLDRLPKGGHREAICPFAPDLAIEVVSPSNSESEIHRKVAIYLRGGTKLVWLVRPRQQTVTVFSPDQPERVSTTADTLDGGDVLPGFRLALAKLFIWRALPDDAEDDEEQS